MIVRRVKDLTAAPGQGELLTAWRYHAVFTDNPHELSQAEAQHRGHAIVEQVFADLFDGPLAHLPSGRFAANAAWLALARLARHGRGHITLRLPEHWPWQAAFDNLFTAAHAPPPQAA